MISRTLTLLLCLVFCLTLVACAEEPGPALQGTVTWIYDGDTLEIDTLGKVRLIGIDTPEREDSSRDRYLAEKGVTAAMQRQIYQAAKKFNITHVKGQKVNLTLDDPTRDRHDRLLAYVHLPDGRLLNRVLVEQGLAVVYRRFEFKMKQEFLVAEDKARRSELGVWEKAATARELHIATPESVR